jgi:hypothetical protein
MKPHFLPIAVVAGLAIDLIAPSTTSAAMVLRSPETVQTYADNSVQWHQLRWFPESHQLVATVTFSNEHYISRVEPRHDETFDFAIPGVKFDQKSGIFSVNGPHGQSIPVAALRHDLFIKDIVVLPGAQIEVHNLGGRVAVDLVASHEPIGGDRWIERHH